MVYTQVQRDAAWIVWQAGFMASGEGWNGEYPFAGVHHDDEGKRTKDLAYLYAAFEEWFGEHCV